MCVDRLSRGCREKSRRGSALLVCTLAAAVLSLAAIAILRSSRHHITRTDASRTSIQGHHVTDGLVQRSIAILRADPNAAGTFVDPNVPIANAYSELTQLSPTATRIQVYLYAGSTTPAFDQVVDPSTL